MASQTVAIAVVRRVSIVGRLMRVVINVYSSVRGTQFHQVVRATYGA